MRDIARMRHDRLPAKTIVQRASDQGVDFKVTPGIEKQLARLGFDADQIDAIRQASVSREKARPEEPAPEKPIAEKAPGEKPPHGEAEKGPPVVPGNELPSSDERRKAVYNEVVVIAKQSGLNLPTVETRHVTLWAAKEDQARFLPDLKKIANYLEQMQAEPLRSGLDKRSAHLVVLKTRYEYDKWINAMHDEAPEAFKLRDSPDGKGDTLPAVLKSSSFYTRDVAVICLAEQDLQWQRRMAAADIGSMNFTQQVDPGRHDPLATGFANVIEALIFGQPRVMMYSNSYHNDNRELGKDQRTWLRLVQDRIRTKKVTGVRALLAMDTTNMLQPHYAEAWTLAGFLAKQPEKFGKLMLALRDEADTLKAIEEVYGWDENKLDAEWHKGVMGQR
jgi:hypothetical protein